MIVIGLDFSLNYPAFCIAKDWQKFMWLAAVNTTIPKVYQKQLEDFQSEFPGIEIIQFDARPKKSEIYSVTERNKLQNFSVMIDGLVDRLAPLAADEKLVISMEGVAYGAQGNALIDICIATGMVRKALLDRVLNGDANRLYVFSPGELKNAIGAKGNANKIAVLEHFKQDPKIEAVRQSSLFQLINKYEDQLMKGTEIKSPFPDMVDAYLAVLKIHEILKEPN